MKPCILITGGSSGIGKNIALELSKEYSLIFISRDISKIQKVVATLHSPNEHFIFECDLLDFDKLTETMREISEKFKIQAFIHSAGVSYVSYAKNFDFNEMIDCAKINLYSAMLIVKFLLKKNLKPYLKDIIFISSTFSKKGEIANSFYASTKGGLDAYMKSLSLELAPNIKVNSILPGGIFETGMTKNLFDEEQKQQILKKYPLGEGKTQDIAQGVKFILDCRWISGQQIIIDGGYSV
ncbi:SDR family oxidoreductase [Helicobacter cappadocius]|uniref:SDR family oxidoreductase n=1 Tax=Helicobacter cappadocius TaxID=3063998 RepID=A0AA90PY65_9HELI|nr:MULTISPECIES: SDR family oxidoreductase [unclassified Helicobacter]MDO7253936.1 SDR family oxidoreductase [Helicobacter sp. faydin-H75]MDP2538698.1 SDR family oxidoreductase [Helicobacter sp. faydin-H76]